MLLEKYMNDKWLIQMFNSMGLEAKHKASLRSQGARRENRPPISPYTIPKHTVAECEVNTKPDHR